MKMRDDETRRRYIYSISIGAIVTSIVVLEFYLVHDIAERIMQGPSKGRMALVQLLLHRKSTDKFNAFFGFMLVQYSFLSPVGAVSLLPA